MNRVLVGIRVQLLGWRHLLGWPWAILALSFVVNVAINAAMGAEAAADSETFGLVAIYTVFFAFSISSVTDVLPFAVGHGLTRRAFFASMSALVVAQAVVYGTVLAVLARVEDATDGWGVDLGYFRPGGLDSGSVVADAAVFAVPFLLVAFLAIAVTLVHQRLGLVGMFGLAALLILVVGGAVVAITAFEWSEPIGDWIGRQSTFALLAGWPLLAVAVLAAAGYAGIRRAVP